MLDIGDDEGSISRVVDVLSRYPDALPPRPTRDVVGVVDSNVRLSIGGGDVSIRLRGRLVDVLNEAVL